MFPLKSSLSNEKKEPQLQTEKIINFEWEKVQVRFKKMNLK